MSREELLQIIKSRYIPNRIKAIEPEFIQYEENFITLTDLERIVGSTSTSLPNPHNSALLYVTGITDIYDPCKGVDTIGGTPPDIDVDFDTVNFHKIIEWIKTYWGEDKTAFIMALQRMKPRSITDKFFMVTTPKDEALAEPYKKKEKFIKDRIPKPLFGKEPSLKEVVYGNSEKRGYEPHPELLKPEYAEWLSTAMYLEGMVSNFSIHAAGIVLSDIPVSDYIPLWYRQTKDDLPGAKKEGRISTQYTMDEISDLGFIKFDFLRIENLSIIQECIKLISQKYNIDIDPYKIQDKDEKAYSLIANGYLAGIFQLETSESARDLSMKIRPSNLGELSDLNALNRPGPMQAGLTSAYINNKNSGEIPDDMPEQLAQLLQETYYTLCYQEQIMSIVSNLAGFTLKEADDVRRAIGKKKKEVIKPYKEAFVQGCIKNGIKSEYAEEYWDKVIVGLADYCFNKSHSIEYSYLTYICAWLKAHYPLEFFTALMSVRSVVLSSKVWAEKAPSYIQEAQHFNIKIKAPDINKSVLGFSSTENGEVYFGFSTITKVGEGASQYLIKAREEKPFDSIEDFFNRVDKQKINTGVFTQLVKAGCFDSLGYKRQDLIDATQDFYDHFKIKSDHETRLIENLEREQENILIATLIERRDDIRKRKKKQIISEADEQFLIDNPRLSLKRPLALPELKPFPKLKRYHRLDISISQIMEQGQIIGCYLINPAQLVFPDIELLSDITNDGVYSIAGIVTEYKKYKGARGDTVYCSISDGTGSINARIFPDKRFQIPEKGDLIKLKARIEVHNNSNSENDDDDNSDLTNILKVIRVFEVDIFKE